LRTMCQKTENAGLREPDLITYKCPLCDTVKEVESEYDRMEKMFFPIRFEATRCECGEWMDRR
jgi:hypothetical protein